MPEVGEKAPDFNLLDQNQARVELKKILSKGKVLLVFYPGNDTPVCTAQLCDYRDNDAQFQQLGVQILGISIASIESHANLKFAEKYSFPFPLLNDYDSRVTKAYKVMSIAGFPKRALYLLGQDGTILYKHVESLPIFRRSSEDLLKDLKEVIAKAPKVEVSASAGHH
ncbi:MAG TPA: redoxin domain-containing protein [bacterium]|nr:redoxin domain-containing protein [bacterium]